MRVRVRRRGGAEIEKASGSNFVFVQIPEERRRELCRSGSVY